MYFFVLICFGVFHYSYCACAGKGLYELKSEAGKIIKKKANVCRLKIYHERKHGDAYEQPPSDADEQPPSDTDKQPPSDTDKQPPSDADEQPPQKKRKVDVKKVRKWKCIAFIIYMCIWKCIAFIIDMCI